MKKWFQSLHKNNKLKRHKKIFQIAKIQRRNI